MSYFEVDLPDVVRRKISIIENTKELRLIGPNQLDFRRGTEPDSLSMERYSIFVHDLSNLEGLADKLRHFGFVFDRPTLVISECAITYIDEDRSTNLIQWASEKLPNGTFMNYEQFNPDDGFGRFMIAHFIKIQSPLRSLTVHRTIRDQRERYLKAGWTHCRVACVMDLFRHIISPSELTEIFKKEPFDEWEEFHLKCCHYSLAVASHRIPELPEWSNLPDPSNVEERMKASIHLTPLEEFKLERFAHSVHRLSDGAVLVIGGFGAVPGGPHRRCANFQYIGTRNKKVRLPSPPHQASLDCLYHACIPLGSDEFVLYGGRTSPVGAVNCDPALLSALSLSADELEVRVEKITLETDAKPPPRWRHAAVSLHGTILVFGGRNKNLEVFGDLWELRRTTHLSSSSSSSRWRWREIRRGPYQLWPEPRFSHAFTSNEKSAYLSGGLDSNFKPLNDLWELTSQDGELVWRELKTTPAVPHVYSHNIHFYANKLVMLGGVNESHAEQPQLTVIDLTTLSVRLYSFEPTGERNAFLLHNFSSIISKEDDSLVCYGGGGNCFSFGTHFNKHPLKISNLTHL